MSKSVCPKCNEQQFCDGSNSCDYCDYDENPKCEFEDHEGMAEENSQLRAQLTEAREVIDAISKMGGDWETMKASAFLAKYPKGNP